MSCQAQFSNHSFSCGKENSCGLDDKESPAYSPGDLDLIPLSGRAPREGNDKPLQYFCLENSMDRRGWQARVHGVTKSRAPLSDYHT